MTEEIRELFNKMMTTAYSIEDRLQYDETAIGRVFGNLVNQLQDFGNLLHNEKSSMVLGNGTINGTEINQNIFENGFHEYYIVHRESVIEDLCRWIGEGSNDRELMKEDLKMLMQLDDEYILSSSHTNDYIHKNDPRFFETCAELLELNLKWKS